MTISIRREFVFIVFDASTCTFSDLFLYTLSAETSFTKARNNSMVGYGFLSMVIDQYTPIDPVLTADLSGKSIIVTGANTGLGLEAAKHFARMGPARLVLACRSEIRGKDAAAGEFRDADLYDG